MATLSCYILTATCTWVTGLGLLVWDFAPEEEQVGTITGQLLSHQGNPVSQEGIYVFVCDDKTGYPINGKTKRSMVETPISGLDQIWHVVAGNDGRFTIHDVPVGSYKLVAQSWADTKSIPTMKGKASTQCTLHGVARNIEVVNARETNSTIKAFGTVFLRVQNDPKENHAFLVISPSKMIGDPVLGPFVWGKEFIGNAIGLTLMEDSYVTLGGLPSDSLIHLGLFNYDNNPGIGGGSYRVGKQEQVTLLIYATWSNGKYDPPNRLLKLVEHMEANQASLNRLLDLDDSKDIRSVYENVKELPHRKVNLDGFGEVPAIDILAASRYVSLRKSHAARRNARP